MGTPFREITLTMDDGVQIACSYGLPPTADPTIAPENGLPAVMLFHGLGGKHQDLAPIQQTFAGAGYATLACDARGHGASGGLADIDGPRTVADVRQEFSWLASQPAIDAKHIGGWGISLGGGAVWNSLVAGVLFGAVETVETWTDLFQALAPQNLSKSGAVYLFLKSLPDSRLDPSVKAVEADALASTDLPAVHAFTDARSSRSALGTIKTPALIFQGRRDFAFGLEQGEELYRGLAGPKRLYIGDFGHAPSTFPGPDIALVAAEGVDWFDRYLRASANGIDTRKPVELAPDPFREAQNVSYAGVPATRTAHFAARGHSSIDGGGRVVRSLGKAKAKLETFGSGIVRVPVTLGAGWTHLVAVLTAQAPDGSTTLIADGGVPTTRGRRMLSIRLLADATTITRGSRLTLILGGTSLTQSPANQLYIASVPSSARITIGRVSLSLPVLQHPISG